MDTVILKIFRYGYSPFHLHLRMLQRYDFVLKLSSGKVFFPNQIFKDRVSKVLVHAVKDEVTIQVNMDRRVELGGFIELKMVQIWSKFILV